MSTYFSQDLFLDIVVMFLRDGLVTVIYNYDCMGTVSESGDLISINRPIRNMNESVMDPAVILGCGGESLAEELLFLKLMCNCYLQPI